MENRTSCTNFNEEWVKTLWGNPVRERLPEERGKRAKTARHKLSLLSAISSPQRKDGVVKLNKGREKNKKGEGLRKGWRPFPVYTRSGGSLILADAKGILLKGPSEEYLPLTNSEQIRERGSDGQFLFLLISSSCHVPS